VDGQWKDDLVVSLNPDPQEFPIGHWVERAHETLTVRVLDFVRDYGLDLLHWQVLNLVYGMDDGTASDHDVSVAEATFVDTREFNGVINDLVGLGWLTELDAADHLLPPIGLTDAGWQSHRKYLWLSAEVRDRSQSGISEDDRRITLATLRRMVDNLERG
jgi:hypothetical protein